MRAFLSKNTESLKDEDFLQLNYKFNELFHINLREEDRRELIKIIQRDTDFLARNNLMDYSLLLAIEEITPEARDATFNDEEQVDILDMEGFALNLSADASFTQGNT